MSAPGERGRQLENFIRLEVFGFPESHWVRIAIDPDDYNVFSFKPEIVPANRY